MFARDVCMSILQADNDIIWDVGKEVEIN
jgi:hypothetical protein